MDKVKMRLIIDVAFESGLFQVKKYWNNCFTAFWRKPIGTVKLQFTCVIHIKLAEDFFDLLRMIGCIIEAIRTGKNGDASLERVNMNIEVVYRSNGRNQNKTPLTHSKLKSPGTSLFLSNACCCKKTNNNKNGIL